MIKTIRNTVINIARKNKRWHLLLFFFVIPLAVISLPLFVKIRVVDESISGNVIAGLSLFVGFFFSLIFVISEKIQIKKEKSSLIKEKDNAKSKKLDAYIYFGKQTIDKVTTAVYVSLFLIVFILLSNLRLDDEMVVLNTYLSLFFQSVNLYFGSILLYFIVTTLKDMHSFFYGQLNSKEVN